ncbi:MAG: VTT domain-containing protein, partial [Pseudohongiella sp.]|nr:VTT domain-containing protein [Pseudohongiella sp.]
DKPWFPVTAQQLSRAQAQFNRYGVWSLLLAWLPVVGDPLTFVAGALRVQFWLFLLLVAIGKSLRYAVLIFLASRLM